jgi:hypothetical protein
MTKPKIPTTTLQAYEQWQAGEIQGEEALKYLCHYIAMVEDQLEPLEKSKEKARAWISEVVEYLGGKAEVDGFGKCEITNASVTYSYDKKQLDQLTNQLRAEGQGDISTMIEACLKSSSRSGGLRITRAK